MSHPTSEWLEILARLVQSDKPLHDATVKLIEAAADNEQSKADVRRARALVKAANLTDNPLMVRKE